MLDVDGLEDAVELELLVVHVAPEVVVADAAVAVAVAGAEQLAGVLALGGHLQRGEARLDLRVVELPAPRGVEEGEHVPDPRLPLGLRLVEREEDVLHGHGRRLPRRLAPARPLGRGRGRCSGGLGRGGATSGLHRVGRGAGHGAGGEAEAVAVGWFGLVSRNGMEQRGKGEAEEGKGREGNMRGSVGVS